MLIKDDVIRKIRSGEITVLFRRWSQPRARSGGKQMTQCGIIGIDAVEAIEPNEISEMDARSAGFASVDDLLTQLSHRDDPIYRIRVYFAGEDPRKALSEKADFTNAELNEVIEKLRAIDSRSRRGPWTQQYLQIIHDRPASYSGLLARSLGLEIPQFKPLVRKLKAMGLTESLNVGYRLSPRGRRVLDAMTGRSAIR